MKRPDCIWADKCKRCGACRFCTEFDSTERLTAAVQDYMANIQGHRLNEHWHSKRKEVPDAKVEEAE